jgi:hypothetical protein
MLSVELPELDEEECDVFKLSTSSKGFLGKRSELW